MTITKNDIRKLVDWWYSDDSHEETLLVEASKIADELPKKKVMALIMPELDKWYEKKIMREK